MLVLSRKKNESMVINGDITVTVVSISGKRSASGITAPKEIPVNRQEVQDAIDGKTQAMVSGPVPTVKDVVLAAAAAST